MSATALTLFIISAKLKSWFCALPHPVALVLRVYTGSMNFITKLCTQRVHWLKSLEPVSVASSCACCLPYETPPPLEFNSVLATSLWYCLVNPPMALLLIFPTTGFLWYPLLCRGWFCFLPAPGSCLSLCIC